MRLPQVHFGSPDGGHVGDALCGNPAARFIAKLAANVPLSLPICGACEVQRRWRVRIAHERAARRAA